MGGINAAAWWLGIVSCVVPAAELGGASDRLIAARCYCDEAARRGELWR